MKTMIQKKGLLLMIGLLTASLLVSCSSDNDVTQPDVTPKPVKTDTQHEIQLQVTDRKANTRALVNSESDLRSSNIRIDAFFHNTTTTYLNNSKLKYVTDAWKFVDNANADAVLTYYWPIAGSVHTATGASSLDFAGYYPYDYTNNRPTTNSHVTLGTYNTTDGINFSCSNLPLPGDQGSLDEFLYAFVPEQTSNSNSGTVNLALQHPFSKISFQVSRAYINLTLNSVTISGFKRSGSFNYKNNPQWLTSGDSYNFTMTVSESYGSSYSFPDAIGGPYIVIPQSADLTFTINATWAGWSPSSTKNIVIPVHVEWLPNTSYIYHIDLDTINFSVSVEAWGTNTDYPLNY